MNKKDCEAIALVIDTGLDTIGGGNRHDFLEKCKECATNIILKKMFSESKDVINLILFGTESTNNPLAEDGAYQNIDILMPFVSASWDLITAVSSIKPSAVDCDWLDALVVGMQCLKEKVEDTKHLKKLNHITVTKLVLFSTFSREPCNDLVEKIVSALIDTDIEVIFIGPDDLVEKFEMPEWDIGMAQHFGVKTLKHIVDKTGTLIAVSEAVIKLSKFSRKRTGRLRWISKLNIGKKISIPVNGYKIMSELLLNTQLRCASDNAIVRRDNSYFHGLNAVEQKDIIYGFMYADAIVPLAKLDTEAMAYHPGEKGLSIIGFVRRDAIHRHYWTGKSGFYVIGALDGPDAESAMSAMSALVKALAELRLVGLARKVYSNDRGLKIGALYPKVDANPPALIFIELPFANEIRSLRFPSLKKTKITEEQNKVIDELIDVMDLSKQNEDEDELYDLTNLIDIRDQFLLHCLAEKGMADMKSSGAVNLELPKFLEEMLQPDPSIQEKSKPVLTEIKTLFPLKPVIRKPKSQNELKDEEPSNLIKSELSDENLEEIPDIFQSSTTAVGSVTPVEDFLMLLKSKDIGFETLCEQIQTVILDLLVRANDAEMLDKPVSALKCLRKTCIETKKTAEYNAWLHNLKETVVKKDSKDFWDILVKDNLGLITQDEMPFSFVSKAEGDEFLDLNSTVRKDEMTDGEIDYDAMLMEM